MTAAATLNPPGLLDRPADPASEYASVFPLDGYLAFLDVLRERDVSVITYDDLFAGSDDWDHESCYEREFRRWHAERRDPERIYLLIQHDVDFVPEFTQRIVALEAAAGVRSNVFLFHEINRDIPAGSPYDDRPYDVDHAYFRVAEEAGFVVGYHQNAIARAGTSVADATACFRDDVAALRRHHAIDYFCPHGGPGRTIDGRLYRNFDLDIPAELRGTLRWVYNRYGVRFSKRYSDGGLRRIDDPNRLAGLDLLAFARSLQPGQRAFALIHPQLWGYNVQPSYNPHLATQPWYRDLCDRSG